MTHPPRVRFDAQQARSSGPAGIGIARGIPLLLPLCLLAFSGCSVGEKPAVSALTGAADQADGAVPAMCSVANPAADLPEVAHESSGLARSLRDAHLFWTHNDANNDPFIFAVDADGGLAGQIRVRDATLDDWEDIDSGPCGRQNCLYVGDIGDNGAERDSIIIYRVVEPLPDAGISEAAVPLVARYPDGPRDSEAMFILPTGDIYLVTKGRSGEIVLYRYPAPQRPGESVVLERIRQLAPHPESSSDRVTGAGASPDGRWVAIRTYRTLYLHETTTLIGSAPLRPLVHDLEPLDEAQGEAVALADDGTVWLTSEAGDEVPPRWVRLQCELPATGGSAR